LILIKTAEFLTFDFVTIFFIVIAIIVMILIFRFVHWHMNKLTLVRCHGIRRSILET